MKNYQKALLNISEAISLVLIFLYIAYYGASRAYISSIKGFITEEFVLTASNVGLLGSAFFISYSFLQPIGGFLLDRYKLYIILPLFFLCSNIANMMFVNASSFSMMIAARFILGASFCITLNGVYKYFSSFPRKYFNSLVNLILVFMYFIGAVTSSGWIKNLMQDLGWRNFLNFFIKKSFILIGVMFLIMWLRRRMKNLNQPILHQEPKISLLESLKLIITNKNYIFITIYALCIAPVSPLLMLGWGNDLIRIKFENISEDLVSLPATLNMIGASIGYIYNILVQKVGMKKRMLSYSLISAASLLMMVSRGFGVTIFFACCFLSGFVNGGHIIGIAWTQANIDKRCVGLGLGILNFIMMFFGNAMVQNISGIILDHYQSNPGGNLISTYYTKHSYSEFSVMFKFMFIPILISFIPIFLIKKKVKQGIVP